MFTRLFRDILLNMGKVIFVANKRKTAIPKGTILVTGGCGFIGSAVVRYLIHHTDYAVVNVDALTYAGDLATVANVKNYPFYHFERADIRDGQKMVELFQYYRPTGVIHLAAESHVDRSIKTPAAFIDTNIVGTATLLEASRLWLERAPSNLVSQFSFVHVSTDEVYGDLPHPDDLPASAELPHFTESSCYRPSSPYSASKAASDHLVRAWQRTYGLPTIITNCSNNYGPWQYPEKLIPMLITRALQEQPLPIYGKGDQIRDWLYVDDHARALVQVLESGKEGETYLIGGNEERRNLEVVEHVCNLLDTLSPRKRGHYAELITHVSDRPGHDRRYAIDSSKIQKQLHWKPHENFESGLEKTVRWYLNNEWWWRTKLQLEHNPQ